jgi:acyl-CoA dehydrogenase
MALDPETLDQLLVTLRKFVEEKLVPLEAQVGEDNLVPPAIIDQMKELGLFGLSIPEEYGGLGLNMEEEALAFIELSRTSPAFRSVFGTSVGLGAQSSDIPGTGIGLTATKQLIEEMGGVIDFESCAGEGATFWIDLPVAQAETV